MAAALGRYPPVIIEINFATGARPRSLAAAVGDGISVTSVDLLADSVRAAIGNDVALANFVEHCRSTLVDGLSPPGVVLAYCTGAPLAIMLAQSLDVPVVIADPQIPEAQDVDSTFAEILESIDPGGQESRPDISALRLASVVGDVGDHLAITLTRTAPDLPADISRELTMKQAFWIGYLEGVRRAHAEVDEASSIVIQHVVLSRDRTWRSNRGTLLAVPCTAGEMFTSPLAAKAVRQAVQSALGADLESSGVLFAEVLICRTSELSCCANGILYSSMNC